MDIMGQKLSVSPTYVGFGYRAKEIRKWWTFVWFKFNKNYDYEYERKHIVIWCTEYTKGLWSMNGVDIYFEDITDAVAFKLRWS